MSRRKAAIRSRRRRLGLRVLPANSPTRPRRQGRLSRLWRLRGRRGGPVRGHPQAAPFTIPNLGLLSHAARALAVVAFAALLAACDVGLPAGRTPHREGNRLDMNDQPKLKPQRQDIFLARPTGLMEPQPGTVAISENPYPYAQNEADRAGAELVNPLQPTPAVVAHGQFVYEQVCVTCHGPKGAGDGHVTALFPKPPSLMTQKVRDWPDGQLFHRPMRGQNSMPSHARQVDAHDAWSVIHYIRQMQKTEPVAPPASASAPASGTTVPPAGASAFAPAGASADKTARQAPQTPGGKK